MATLIDVARRANVTAATVSNVLRNPDKVRPETTERVMRAIRELGYRPNLNARALAEARGASVIAQRDFTPEALCSQLTALFSTPDMLAHAAAAAQSIARPDAAARLADVVEDLMRQEART